jgi:phosphate-selective porin OprO/OprP
MGAFTTRALAAVLALITAVAGFAPGQEHGAPRVPDSVHQRVRRLEAEIASLRQHVNRPVQTSWACEQLPSPEPAAKAQPGLPPLLPEEELKPAIQEEKQGYPTIKPHGAFQADAGWWSQSPANRITVGDVPDGADFRRARLGVSGAAWENVNYWLQMDFAFPGRPTFTDVWGEVNELPVLGNVRAGQWKQPFGLEEITSYRFNPFLERASVFLFKPFRRIGVGFYDWSEDERVVWAISTVRAGQDQYGGDLGDAGGAAVVARLAGSPVYEDDGRSVLHFGTSYWVADPANDLARFGVFGGNSPEFALIQGTAVTPSFVDTGNIPTNFFHAFQVEAALVEGPFSLQTEVVTTYLSQIGGPPVRFWGGYVFATYFLTGEHRVYNRRQGAFDRIIPHRDFNPCKYGTWSGGAWELAARLSHVDLTNQNIVGGRLTDVTLGINWYLNPYAKLMFNWIHASLHRPPFGPSNADVYAIRAQVDF